MPGRMKFGMKFGLRKCAAARLSRGRPVRGGPVRTAVVDIREIEEEETYKYLGVSQVFGAELRSTKVCSHN